MPLIYTDEQLIRETQLLVTTMINVINDALGDEAGVRALGLEETSHFATTLHPDELNVLFDLPIWQDVRTVEAYARHYQWDESVVPRLASLKRIVETMFSKAMVESFLAERRANPLNDPIPGALDVAASADELPLGYLYQGILAELVADAEARLKVDRGERLSMADVARLTGVVESTVVTNAHRKNFDTFEESNRRFTTPSAVMAWMLKQGYRPTRGKPDAEDCGPQKAAVRGLDNPYVFVPVAGDGKWFSPEHQRNGLYTIVQNGREETFSNYFEALAALTVMDVPRWLAPYGYGGAWAVVAAPRFDRIRRAVIENMRVA